MSDSGTHARPLRIAIVNDYHVVVAGLAGMLAEFRERVIVVERDHRVPVASDVDIILCDEFGTVEGEGIDLTDLLGGNAKVVVYAWRDHPEAITKALGQGVSGYLSKGLTSLELVEALEAVAAGQTVVSSFPVQEDQPGGGEWPGQEAGLTMREAEVLALIAKGLTNEHIAKVLFLSVNTVKTYVRTGYRRIGVKSRSQAVAWALHHGFAPDTYRVLEHQPASNP